MTEPQENKPRADEERFDTLHNLVTEELINRCQASPEIGDIKAAMDWLRHNGITAPKTNRSLGSLANMLPELDITMIQERVNGTKALV